ncbi:hypothetical protein SAMN05421847_0025 [Halpernia humi]|uniref:Uncharacterized protein n=1 Tax=Halpernia humi TaxID=493375 RepID=A0A1H5S4G6_9FLAO|nr:hypothetical protein SAMN05421847_0025 [Halpernia humi]
MKSKLIIYFLAFLDILTCFKMSILLEMFIFDFLHILFLILLFSFVLSAIFLIWKTKKGLILNFIQFPFRIYFAIYSFWFISIFFKESKDFVKPFFIIATILECFRIIFEIYLYRKFKNIY